MGLSRRHFAHTLTSAALVGAAARRAGAQSTGVFRHGVASGDPLLNRVVIWTRITPARSEDPIVVEWSIAEDPLMQRVRQRGVTSTGAAWDFTVKVDVARLDPGTAYYYQFRAQGADSPVGRTRTVPAGGVDRLRFAVVSCSNYPYGFFNSYRLIANRQDLDFVTHLGDYIYEYGNGVYGDGSGIGRSVVPDKEITVLADYRQRYAQYRTDPDLQEAHRQHPWIVVWDDHESANDAWVGGAQNHTAPGEGEWNARRAMATQAWFEWMPVRENPYLGGEIYRNFRFGNLMDLVMLDTRLEGREQQDPAAADPGRRLISAAQESWLFQELSASRDRGTRWRFVGQQVMMGQLLNPNGTPFNVELTKLLAGEATRHHGYARRSSAADQSDRARVPGRYRRLCAAQGRVCANVPAHLRELLLARLHQGRLHAGLLPQLPAAGELVETRPAHLAREYAQHDRVALLGTEPGRV